MRPALAALLLLLAACAGPSPVERLTAFGDPAEADRRGGTELAVKTSYPAILDDIAAGGGPVLTAALDAAGVPESDRPTRILQLQRDRGLYESNPGALALALFTYGS